MKYFLIVLKRGWVLMLKHNINRDINYKRKDMKNAVALAYDKDKDQSPVVVASGAGHIAQRIIEVAQESGVPIYEDETAAALLSQLELGEEIPVELYEVVAEIFAYILKKTTNHNP